MKSHTITIIIILVAIFIPYLSAYTVEHLLYQKPTLHPITLWGIGAISIILTTLLTFLYCHLHKYIKDLIK